MSDPTTLAEAAAAVKQAERDLAKARHRLDSALYRAVHSGTMNVTEAAEAAGVSRVTVYKATGRAG
jgi:transcriptional regulator of acetoin/glycerol metabolism